MLEKWYATVTEWKFAVGNICTYIHLFQFQKGIIMWMCAINSRMYEVSYFVCIGVVLKNESNCDYMVTVLVERCESANVLYQNCDKL